MHTAGTQLFYHFTVMRFRQKVSDTLCHHRPDIMHLLQTLHIGGKQIIQRAEVLRQVFCGGLADIADAERENETRQRGVLAVLDRSQ